MQCGVSFAVLLVVQAQANNLRIIEDAAQAHLAQWNGKCAGTIGDYGSFSVGADGGWTYDLDPAAADALPAGEVVTETFEVLSADGTPTKAVSPSPLKPFLFL